MLKQLMTVVAASVLLCCAGCGSPFEIAPVSGVVTLDDKPLANATIFFMPMGDGAIGPSSSAVTGDDGRFTLKTPEDGEGAVVGKHRVSISTVVDTPASGDDNIYDNSNREKLPSRYNSASTLEFDVPAEGTDAANFALQSK